MIYRIHEDSENFLHFHLSADEVEDKLGGDSEFYLEREPTRYQPIWKPLEIEFYESGEAAVNQLPDLDVGLGRLFLNQKAYDLLSSFFKDVGEFLPVTFSGQSGFLLNILNIADEERCVDTQLTTRNEWGDLTALSFLEAESTQFNVFRSDVDGFGGVYCNDAFKETIEEAGLTGVLFTNDLTALSP
ncbi:MAG: hypothetical protein ACR2PX_25705 [Endozoicomonas sp.]|uniref:hypothetical protein n=1 Tax=Endozoicomonas sp. TaxID=1892382 RepID=UPI003D9B370F